MRIVREAPAALGSFFRRRRRAADKMLSLPGAVSLGRSRCRCVAGRWNVNIGNVDRTRSEIIARRCWVDTNMGVGDLAVGELGLMGLLWSLYLTFGVCL